MLSEYAHLPRWARILEDGWLAILANDLNLGLSSEFDLKPNASQNMTSVFYIPPSRNNG